MEVATHALPLWSEWIKWGADLALFLATGLLAIYTAKLFRETRNTAQQTGSLVAEAINDRKMTERHHRESLLPVVTFISEAKYVRPQDRAGPEIYQEAQIIITGVLQNAGTGPALDCMVEASILGFAPVNFTLGALRAGFVAEGRTMFFNVHHDGQIQRATFLPFSIKIGYTDAFGQMASTMHMNPGGPWSAMSTVVNRPVFKAEGD